MSLRKKIASLKKLAWLWLVAGLVWTIAQEIVEINNTGNYSLDNIGSYFLSGMIISLPLITIPILLRKRRIRNKKQTLP